MPATFELQTNYPNPFNPETIIPFGLPEASPVTIEVFNMLGRRVAVLLDREMPAGWHEITGQAATLPTGLYLVRLRAGAVLRTQRVTLVK